MPRNIWQMVVATSGNLSTIALLVGLTGWSSSAHANEITVFDVRQAIPLTNEEKVFRDYYINGGTEVGIKEGLTITVTRRKTLYDAYQNRSPGDLHVPVGVLQVIHSQKGLSVARMKSLYSRKNLPMLEYPYIMVGDKLDMKTAKMQKKAKKTVRRSKPKPTVANETTYGPLSGEAATATLTSKSPEPPQPEKSGSEVTIDPL